MKTKTLLALVVLLVAACDVDPTVRVSSKYTEIMQTIPELRDCKTFRLNDGSRTIYVTRCQKLETISTTAVEKNPTHSVTVLDPNVVMDSDNVNSR